MRIIHTKKQDLQTVSWSGGTTTQLAIYPKEAVYKKLDFIFRISTATIDVEKSDFTPLPSISRCIMILNGELTILHKDHYTKRLKKFDTDNFSGNWKTTSLGKATDFNVMTSGQVKSALTGFSFQGKASKEFILDGDVTAVYVYVGQIEVEGTFLEQGDIALISREHEKEKFIVNAEEYADIVITQIYF